MRSLVRRPLYITVCLLAGVSLVIGGCGAADDDAQPLDLKQRIPSPGKLRVSLPGSAGPAESPSALLHDAVRALNAGLSPLGTLDAYLEDGGERQREVTLLLALETPPHAADAVTRYKQDASRLDVERINDHAFYYLQVPGPKGYDPDQQITNAFMLIDGGSLPSKSVGERPSLSSPSGLANTDKGYLRIHFNRHNDHRDEVQDAVHLDYDLASPVKGDAEATEESLHFVFYRQEKVPRADGQRLAVWIRRDKEGGFVLQSETKGSGATWSFLAQYRNDGSHAVWDAKGKIMGCYNGGGTELGTAEDPTPCAVFDRKFVSPPKLTGIWPGLPGAVPK